jgi:predicted metal-dependent phosphoesterase TrpH
MTLNQFRADLHSHTTFSDGSMTPEESISLAASLGLGGMSITDHDTIKAYGTAFEIAERNGIKLIPGVEFSTVHKGENVHILAYSFSLKSESLLAFCEEHRERRRERMSRIVLAVQRQGMDITEDEVKAISEEHGSVGRPHIARLMMEKGYVKDIQDAFRRYLGEEKSCYCPTKGFRVQETIDVIHKAHGKAVLAHPHLIRGKKVIKDLLTIPLDGIEAYYSHMPPSRERRWVQVAREKEWLITGGSDFHGTVKPYVRMGASWVGEETFNKLYDHYQQVRDASDSDP